jgi:hypothetical protein
MAMGLLMDLRSGKRDTFGLGGYAVIFWFLAGSATGGAVGAYAVGGLDKPALTFGCVGAIMGLCIGFYAAFGDTKVAKALTLPGFLIAMLAVVTGVG